MHHCTGTVVHNGVVLVLASVCVTVVAGAAFLLAVKVARTEVPAAGTLHNISPKRRHVPHLRGSRMPSGIGQRSIASLDLRMSGNFAQRREGPKTQAVLISGDSAEAADVAYIDKF